jgi:hypothetical protein
MNVSYIADFTPLSIGCGVSASGLRPRRSGRLARSVLKPPIKIMKITIMLSDLLRLEEEHFRAVAFPAN